MRELYEFRLFGKAWGDVLEPEIGKVRNNGRHIKVHTDEPLFDRIIALLLEHKGDSDYFATHWPLSRSYTESELSAARLFKLEFKGAFGPMGEECGTVYDDAKACEICQSGGPRIGPLRLDLRRAPKSKDFCQTHTNEWIVSQKVAELVVEHGIRGCTVVPVQHRSFHDDTSVDLHRVPAGRELLKTADAEGIDPRSWEFTVWLNRDEQQELWWTAHAEFVSILKKKVPKPVTPRYELAVDSPKVDLTESTVVGNDIVDYDEKGLYSCKYAGQPGHQLALNCISECYIRESTFEEGYDIYESNQLTGIKMGLLRPMPAVFISPRFRELILENNLSGHKLEVAYIE